MEFTKKVHLRVANEFPSKSDIADVLSFVKEQRVPGELVISIPGNGGVTSIMFREKEKVHSGEIPMVEEKV